MTAEQGKIRELISGLLGRGATSEQIEAELVQQGQDTRFAKEIVAEVTRLYYAKRRAQGLALVLAGALVCLISCVLALVHSGTQQQAGMALIGLTSLGIGLVFVGFMKIF